MQSGRELITEALARVAECGTVVLWAPAGRPKRAGARIVRAVERLHDQRAGYPTGSGFGGSGGSRAIVIDGEQIPVTSVEALALAPDDDAERALATLDRSLDRITARTTRLLGREVAYRSSDPATAVSVARLLLQRAAPQVWERDVAHPIWAAALDLHGVVMRWSADVTDQERATLGVETGDCCEHHARLGLGFEPVHQRKLCRWCDAYLSAWGHRPPRSLVDMHGRGIRISERMVLEHDPIVKQDALRRAKRQAVIVGGAVLYGRIEQGRGLVWEAGAA